MMKAIKKMYRRAVGEIDEVIYSLGKKWLSSVGMFENDRLAVMLLHLPAMRGHTHAQSALGHYYLYQVENVKFEAAEKWFNLAAEKGDCCSQFHLAELYFFYREPTDFNSAAKWYLEAAEQGDEDASYMFEFISTHCLCEKCDHRKRQNDVANLGPNVGTVTNAV